MNWNDLLPPHIAIEQIAWERRRMIRRVLASFPIQQKEMAKKLGISPARIWQIASYHPDDEAPIFKWMRKPVFQERRDAKKLVASLNALFEIAPD